MSDDDITDLLERITGCINNAEYDDEADTLMDALVVIEAQAAEIERLRELIKVTGDHWLELQHKHPIQWEGAIDGAMAAACAEIERLREALMKISLRKWNSMTQGCNAAREANDIARAALEARND